MSLAVVFVFALTPAINAAGVKNVYRLICCYSSNSLPLGGAVHQ